MKLETRNIRQFFLLFLIINAALFIVSIVWNIHNQLQAAKNYALIEAKASYNKDLLYRRWASMHGGVYVPITEQTPPNPNLLYIEDRNIRTDSGKEFTLVNPAYMTRQVHELAQEEYGVKGHITSLNPIRKQNAPDTWETHSLELFENGIIENYEIKKTDDLRYMRYMQAMVVEESCLKCHAHQGYKLGDIRGGISVSVPMDNYNEVAFENIRDIALTHLLIFIGLLVLTSFSYQRVIEQAKRNKLLRDSLIANELKLQEQNSKLIIAKNKAEESDRLKDSFLKNISHEIRTPLNGILGFSELLEKTELSDEKRKSFAGIISSNSRKLYKLFQNILEVSSAEAEKTLINNTMFSINEFLLEIYSEFEMKSSSKKVPIYLKKALPDSNSLIISDKHKLNIIVTNLLENAVKYTHEGYIEIGYKTAGEEITIHVKDTGIGISRANIKNIFKYFIQVKSKGWNIPDGLGIGLPIAKENARQLGGKLTVESTPGKGSTFLLKIPYVTTSQVDMDKKEDTIITSKQRVNPFTILVVEDESVNYLLIETILKNSNFENYKLIHANNGEKAIQMFIENKAEIDLVIMDINLPGMDGIETTKEILKIRKNIPVIAQTAYVLKEDIEKYHAYGFSDLLPKPIVIDLLLEMVRKYSNW
ncbi:MAG: DUF3365 domain-containing protein [Bacteroidales bacterium]|nr:DUF3365 domain-containing protein [Bacteroidales bacterium]MBN2817359.1 DUF3365 domain-containing protein [Bacteroidales bacterium]